MLRRRIPQSGHLMTAKRFWLQTLPSTDCDIVVTFPPGTSEVTVTWLRSQLQRISELSVITRTVSLSSGRGCLSYCFSFQITASYNGFLRGLEELRIQKPIKEDLGGGVKEFSHFQTNNYKHVEDLEKFLSSAERQCIILHLINGLRAGPGDELDQIKFRDGEAIVPKCLSKGILSQIYPLHDLHSLKHLQRGWVQKIFGLQPLDEIREYFGVKIGLYFAWLGHYTTALTVPALVGSFFWVFFCGRVELLEDLSFVLFSFFNVLWATLYLTSWKRRSAELSYKWGTIDKGNDLLSEPRPLYQGEERISNITGKPEPFYPSWKRNCFRYLVTIPVILFSLFLVFLSVFLMLEFQEWMDKLIATQNLVSLIRYLPKIGLAILIPILDKLYNSVAVWLNNKENYRTEESFENQLIIKKTLFQFVNSFFALFYTAFYLQDVDKLKELLAALLITRQVVGNLKESLLPYASKQLKLAKMSFDLFGALSPTSPEEKSVGEHRKTDSSTGVQEYRKTDRSTGVQEYRKTDRVSSSNPLQEDWKEKEGEERRPTNKVQGARLVSQVEIEGSTLQYEGTFDDYLEMFIQFGYVTLFSSAYPLAGLCALLNNLIEIRSDAFKLCFIHQRPFAQRVSNIGSWQTAMEVMGDIGVVVNCGLIGLLGPVHRIFPDITPAQQVFLIVLLEHLMLLLKLLVTAAIPDTPCWLTEEIAKIEHKKKTVERNYFNRSMSLGSMDVEDKVTQHETCSCKEKTEEFTLNLQVNEITEPKEDEEWEGPLQGIEESTFRNHRYTQQYNTGSTLGSLSISSVNENPTVFQDGNRQDQSSQVKEIDLIKTRSFSLCSGEKATVTRSENLPRDALGRDISATYGEHKPDLGNIIVNNVPTPAFHASYQLKSCATPPHKRVLEQKEFDKKLKAKGAFFLKGRSLSLASFKLPARFKLDRAEKIPMKRKLSKERRNCEEDRSYGDQEVVRGELELLNIEELINIQDLDVQINQRLRKS